MTVGRHRSRPRPDMARLEGRRPWGLLVLLLSCHHFGGVLADDPRNTADISSCSSDNGECQAAVGRDPVVDYASGDAARSEGIKPPAGHLMPLGSHVDPTPVFEFTSMPSAETFVRDFVAKRRPVVLRYGSLSLKCGGCWRWVDLCIQMT